MPYDSVCAICAHADVHAGDAYTASYLTGQDEGGLGGGDLMPESSWRLRHRAWAAIRSLGRSGVAELVDRCCALARRFAAGLSALDGVEIVNDVVLNQVLVPFGDDDQTDRGRAARSSEEGTCGWA